MGRVTGMPVNLSRNSRASRPKSPQSHRENRGFGDYSADLDCALEVIDLVETLPRQVDVGAAEVAVRGRRRVDRTQQVQVANNRTGPKIEHLGHDLLDLDRVDDRG